MVLRTPPVAGSTELSLAKLRLAMALLGWRSPNCVLPRPRATESPSSMKEVLNAVRASLASEEYLASVPNSRSAWSLWPAPRRPRPRSIGRARASTALQMLTARVLGPLRMELRNSSAPMRPPLETIPSVRTFAISLPVCGSTTSISRVSAYWFISTRRCFGSRLSQERRTTSMSPNAWIIWRFLPRYDLIFRVEPETIVNARMTSSVSPRPERRACTAS